MCFYNVDYDWYADVSEEGCVVCQVECRCQECWKSIKPGEWIMTLWQQQYEECRLCSDEDEEPIPHTQECDFGETYSYQCCHDCARLREVIYEVETDEECPEHARHPSFEGMQEEAFDCGDNADKYVAKAAAMYPGWTHRYLDQFLQLQE